MNDFGDQPSLDDIARSDAFIDALAGGRQAAATDDTDAMLAAMLGDWRDELRWPPESELISEDAAFAAIQSGIGRAGSRGSGSRGSGSRNPGSRGSGSQIPGRGRRQLGVVGAAAAAVLCLGGFGAVVAGSGPGDALYGLRTMLFGAPKQVRDDQVALAAQAELYQVQQLIAQGDWQQAQDKLVAVSNKVAAVGDQQQKQELFNQWNQLSARVVERDPQATVPPGITYTVLPSVNELVPTPAPTTLPSMPPITLAVPSEESPSVPEVSATGSPAPNPSVTTELPGTTSALPTDLPSSSLPTSPMQETQQASTSAPAPTSASPTQSVPTSAATSAPATSAPASSAPATSVSSTATPQTSSAAAGTSASNSAAVTTTPPAASSGVPSSGVLSSSVAQTSEPAAASNTPAATQQSTALPATTAPAATTAQQQAQPTKQPSAAVVTTTAAPGA